MTTREQLIEQIKAASDFQVKQLLGYLEVLKSLTQEDEARIDANQGGANLVSNYQGAKVSNADNTERSNRPIWELFIEAADSIPPEALEDLPVDGAEQLDHYLYGTPKR